MELRQLLVNMVPEWVLDAARWLTGRPPYHVRQAVHELPLGAEQRTLPCYFGRNRYGSYCVPRSSAHRPAARAILSGEVWEPDTLDFMMQNAGDGDIVHAGTYFGDFLPALAEAVGARGRVWAFEPDPVNYHCARITAALNDLSSVSLRNAGLGSESGEFHLKVRDERGGHLGGLSQFTMETESLDPHTYVKADIVTLDEVIPESRHVSILQLDVEGFEQQALAGSLETIRRCYPILILERVPGSEWFTGQIESLGYRPARSLHANVVLQCI